MPLRDDDEQLLDVTLDNSRLLSGSKLKVCGVLVLILVGIGLSLGLGIGLHRKNNDTDASDAVVLNGSVHVANWEFSEESISRWNGGQRRGNRIWPKATKFCDTVASLNITGTCEVTEVKRMSVGVGVGLKYRIVFDDTEAEVDDVLKQAGSKIFKHMTSHDTFTNVSIIVAKSSVLFDDGDECKTAECPQYCRRLPWDHECMCYPGYRSHAPTGECIDIDECSEEGSLCGGSHSACVNTPGTFQCQCEVGYKPDDTWTCQPTCPHGYRRQGNNCTDVDECHEVPGLCGPGNCTNTLGNYSCLCPQGYEPRTHFGILSCHDLDECKLDPHRCPSHNVCQNLVGSYQCHPRPHCHLQHTLSDGSCSECSSPYKKRCDNGTCQEAVNWCSGSVQCADMSDLLHCTVPCKENQFRCDLNLHCLANKHWNDGKYYNCVDKSDEVRETPYSSWGSDYDWMSGLRGSLGRSSWTCKPGYKKCTVSNHQCVHESYFCDGVTDCEDESDERSCSGSNPNMVVCGYQHDRLITVPRRKRCDGHRDCWNGADEPPSCSHACLSGQWRCDNGRCIEQSERCNGENDCGDSSDEDGCQLDCHEDHLCGQKCIHQSQMCDGNLDCNDLSDEMNCDCTTSHRFLCDNGACIRSVFVCNGIDDCTDGSDERGCNKCLEDGNFLCPSNQRCLPRFTLCDGERDCPQGEDELYCDTQNELDAILNGRPPTPYTQMGVNNRKRVRLGDHTGMKTNRLLLYAFDGRWRPVCSEGVKESLASEVCIAVGKSYIGRIEHKGLSSRWTRAVANIGWLRIKPTSDNNFLSDLPMIFSAEIVANCVTEQAVYVTCNDSTSTSPANSTAPTPGAEHIECGLRSRDVDSGVSALIVGGHDAEPGHWPWQAQIFYQREFICGGSVLSNRFVITAAHCVAHSRNASDYEVHLGSTRLNGTDPHRVVYKVDRAVQHRAYSNETLQNDVALLRTSRPIMYTDYIRPVCLTSAFQNNHDQRRCFISGWGVYTLYRASPNDLREMRAQIQPAQTCQDAVRSSSNNDKLPDVVNDKMVCVDFDLSDTCYGDSGGPLVCRQPDQSFLLVGLTSWGPQPWCQMPTLFTNLTTYVPWVQTETGLDFS